MAKNKTSTKKVAAKKAEKVKKEQPKQLADWFAKNKGNLPEKVSGAVKAGTIFSPARCMRNIRGLRVASRYNKDCGAFMAGVLEYLTGELLELGCGIMDARKMKTLKPSHMNLGIRQDDELSRLFYGAQLT